MMLLSENINLFNHIARTTDRQTDGRTDRQTDRQDYYNNTALCTKVHRAVKIRQQGPGDGKKTKIQGKKRNVQKKEIYPTFTVISRCIFDIACRFLPRYISGILVHNDLISVKAGMSGS